MKNKKAYVDNLVEAGYPLTAKYINAIGKEARSLSQKYNIQQDYEDFFQLSLIEATRLEPIFDETKGSTFMTFIRKPIKQIMQKLYGFSRSSTNKYNKILRFMKAYEKEHKVLPTVPVIAKALGMTEWLLKSIYYGKPLKVSLDSLGSDFVLDNEQTELSDTIKNLLEGLSDDDRKLITFYYLEEYSIDELALLLNIPIDILNDRIIKILEVLRKDNNG